jgi:AraC family transcriptional regulator
MRQVDTQAADVRFAGRYAETAHAVMALLSDAERRLASDRTGARWSITHARSLLEAEQDGGSTSVGAAKGGLPSRTARTVSTYIEDNLDRPIRVVDLTAIARLSTRHFSLAFTQSFGQPPHAYIVKKRIEQAQKLMLTTDEPLSQIALACGLADQSHLNKWFRRMLGVTPSVWRRRQLA